VGRYFIQKKNLIGREPEDLPHQGMDLGPGQAGQPGQQIIQANLPALHPLDQFQQQGPFPPGKVGPAPQGIGQEVFDAPVPGLGVGQDGEGQFPGGGWEDDGFMLLSCFIECMASL
jgi:hypothetical protein